MLTGEPPHKGTLSDRLLSRQGAVGSSVRLRAGLTSPGFPKIWRRMVAEKPDHRFDRMADVAEALQAELSDWREGRRIRTPSRRIVLGIPTLLILAGLAAWGASHFIREDAPTRKAQPGPAPARAIAPFDAKQGQLVQQQWADYLNVPVRVENSIGMRLVLVPSGEFEMGLLNDQLPQPQPPPDDWRYQEPEALVQEHLPVHRVVLTQAYYFGETEITFAQFRQFVEASGYVTEAEQTRGWGKEDKGWLLRSGYSWKKHGAMA